MKKLEKNSVVIIGGKELEVKERLGDLVKLSAESILNYFTSLGLTFPRRVRVEPLKEVISPYVYEERPLVKPLTDELVYRLRWFETFSEAQLVNLLPILEDGLLGNEYKEALWLSMLDYMLEKQVSEENFNRLFSLAENLRNTPILKELDGKEYNDVLNPIFFDEPNTIDGLTLEIFRPVVYKCSTLDEVRNIGKKYGVDVPRRLKKKELVEIIKEELEDRGKLTDEVSTKLDGMTVIPLQRFAINNDIKVSIELKKEEIIEYILKNAKQTKEKYFKPQTGSYEVFDRDDFVMPVAPVEVAPEVEKVVVTFNADNGLAEQEIFEIAKGDVVRRPFTPTREGYRFAGWYLGNQEYNFGNEVLKDITLFARWEEIEPEKVFVIFNYENDTAPLVLEVLQGEKIIPPVDPIKEGFNFVGWYQDGHLYNFEHKVFEEVHLFARWKEIEPEKVVVTIVYDNNLDDGTLEVIKGEPLSRLADPVKENHNFVGWYFEGSLYDFETLVYHDLTLTAVWEEMLPDRVYITFDYDNGSAKEIVDVLKGEKVNEPEVPIKEGYDFIGWYYEGITYDFNEVVNEDVTLVAFWEEIIPDKVFVTFNYDSELIENKQVEIIKGTPVEEPEKPEKEGYVFIVWNLDGTEHDFTEAIYHDITLIAYWEEIEQEEIIEEEPLVYTNLDEVVKEIKNVYKAIEDLKDATYIMVGMSGVGSDRMDDVIDFSDRKGFEGIDEGAIIKAPIVLMPYELKVSKKKWNELTKRKDKKEIRAIKSKKKRNPVPVVVVEEDIEDDF